MMHSTRALAALTLLGALACSPTAQSGLDARGITPETHTQFFPIGEGAVHAMSVVGGCEACHPSTAQSFEDFSCVGCHTHGQEVTDLLHNAAPGYAYGAQTCYGCHPAADHFPYSHSGITSGCATCHAVGAPFASLPKPSFTHPEMGGADCGSCHTSTSSWANASQAPTDSRDPSRDLTLDGLVPTWVGTRIASLTVHSQTLPMVMNHASGQIPAGANSSCGNCHDGAAQGRYLPGSFHASLIALDLPSPTGCSDCHAASEPQGFVGPIATHPARSPPSGEMRHEAVAWGADNKPTHTRLVSAECGQCHRAPTTAFLDATWGKLAPDGGVPQYHRSLAQQQPSSCIDCHANSRPTALLTLPSGLSFDHDDPAALGDCKACHSNAAALEGTSWAGGTYHAATPVPTTCLPCHEGERPTSTANWRSTTYRSSPFDYVTNSRGIRHGGNQDCVTCHTRTQDWTFGRFPHGPNTVAATQCISCHTTQRPDLLPGTTAAQMATLLGFDHSVNGTGDCFGCHQATVTANRYVNFFNPATGNLPGGDWKDGVPYPGSFLVSTDQPITVSATKLNRSGANNLVTSMSTVLAALYNGMLHTSSQLPAALNAGPTGNPDYGKCWHCHTHNNGTVTSYAGGLYHAALTNHRPTPTGTVSPMPQPTEGCAECHANTLPSNIVQKGTTDLQPMDHSAQFTATVTIGGKTVSSVSQVDCSVCHRQAGTSWGDGVFHARIGNAVPKDCTRCHYPLMADAAKSDVTSGTRYKMVHRSGQITFQACETCHTAALSKAATTPAAATLWQPGVYHGSLTSQPAACTECHAVSQPSTATQGTELYSLVKGAGATNQAQWMNHASPTLAGRDCAACHASDAKPSGSAWSKSSRFHDAVGSVTSCRECHGVQNGRSTVAGTDNNLPVGLTDSDTVTTAGANTGVPAGTRDQISHTDLNVTQNDCRLCHTQQGSSTTAGVQGKEWAQASFHRNFTASRPLVLNGTTGRCSNCHMNVRPTSAYPGQDHSSFTASSTQDCSSCHTYPGSSATTPSWRGATGAHAASGTTAASTLDCSSCHGQNGTSSKRLSVPASSHFGGITNGNKCISCHIDFTAFDGPVTVLKYAHTNAIANANGCVACHSFVNQLYTPLSTTPSLTLPTVAGGRQFSQTRSVTGTFNGDSFTANHTNANLTRCGACHEYAATTANTNVWAFRHRPENPGISNSKSTSGCNMCH